MTSENLKNILTADVMNAAFEVAKSNINGVLPLVETGDESLAEEGYKYSWLDMKVDAGGSVLSAAIDNAATTVKVAEGGRFRKGMTVSVKDSEEVMVVKAINGNDLTVERGFGGTTPDAAPNGSVILIDGVGRPENSMPDYDGIEEPETHTNYFQTFDTSLDFSRRMLSAAQHGNYNDVSTQMALRMEQIMIQLNRTLIRGRRGESVIDGKKVTYVGGLSYFLSQPDALSLDNAGAAVTESKINDIVEEVVLRGGTCDTIICNTRLARVINGILLSKVTSQRLKEYQDDQNAMTKLASDLPLAGFVTNVVLDTNVSDTKLYMLDSKKVRLIPMSAGNGINSGRWRTEDATQKGQDGVSMRVIGDLTFELKNSKTHFAELNNIG